jgi:hypothetical protein
MPANVINLQRTYAVVVRDSADLFLFLSLARAASGDVYVNILHNQQGLGWERWKPHSSYHASGQHHQKSFGRKGLVYRRQKPDANFRGTENVVTMGIVRDEARRLNTPCEMTDFQEAFEIPVDQLKPEGRTHISVDLTEPNGKAIISLKAKVIQQYAFKDTVPWILVTLFETGSP